MHKLLIEKPRGKYRCDVPGEKKPRWVNSATALSELPPGSKHVKMKGKYKCTVTKPSGKTDVHWLFSFTAITQLRETYGIDSKNVQWRGMA